MTEYRDADPADAGALGTMARLIFEQTFAAEYEPAAFAAYCDEAFGPALRRDLADPAVAYRLAVEGAAIVGYAKYSPLMLPAPDPAPGAAELRQLYVRRDRHGSGVAAALMDWTIAQARGDRASELYLAVFDYNARARAFYARYGFVEVGEFDFRLGDRVDRDRIWRLEL